MALAFLGASPAGPRDTLSHQRSFPGAAPRERGCITAAAGAGRERLGASVAAAASGALTGSLAARVASSAARRSRRSRHAARRRWAAAAGAGGGATSSSTPVPVWVVNLDRSTDRWDKCLRGLLDRGLTTVERFSATYGKELPPDELLRLSTWSARLFCTPGMIGCFISHMRAWQRLVDEDLPAAVVLEDDSMVFEGFNGRLAQLLEELPTDWDVCLLGAVGCISVDRQPFASKLYAAACGGWRRSPGTTRSISEHLYIPFKPAGTHAYMVSRRGAAKLLERLPRATYHVDLTAWSLQDLNLYAAKEFLATQDFQEVSTVSKGRDSRTQRFLQWTLQAPFMSKMIEESGAPLEWSWKVVMFAIPVPFTTKRVLMEAGPSYAVCAIMILLSMLKRSVLLLAVSLSFFALVVFTMRWLSGTYTHRTAAIFVSLVTYLYYLALA